ncbi:signal peptidase I [Clostridium sp. HCS.1]|uniref:signal peptidase I n=1 Tax=Clostridium sp. HCS.1 TaxID=3238594 RepID=UPI003A101972
MTENNIGKNEKEKSSIKNFIYEWGVPIISAFIIAFLINKFLLFKVLIPTGSMIPTLNVGDRLFVTRVYNLDKLERGDIVVFYSEELQEDLIKRLIGLPGDKVEIKNGIVSVNGEVLEEDYIGSKDNWNGVYEVPEGKYFFLGDNREDSKDSRYWINPYIDGKDITGKAQVKVYPLDQIGKVK